MSSKQRIEKIRVPRNGTARHRSLAGGQVIGDYIDPTNGERVLTVEKVAAAPKVPGRTRKPTTTAFPPTEAPSGS